MLACPLQARLSLWFGRSWRLPACSPAAERTRNGVDEHKQCVVPLQLQLRFEAERNGCHCS